MLLHRSDNATPQHLFPSIKGAYLTRRDGSLRMLEDDVQTISALLHCAALGILAITDLRFTDQWKREIIQPLRLCYSASGAKKTFVILLTDDDGVRGDILCNDIERRASSDTYPFPLADGVLECPIMRTDDASSRILDRSTLGFDMFFEEAGKIDLADEAQPLRILAVGIGQSYTSGDVPHLGFEQMPDRKKRLG